MSSIKISAFQLIKEFQKKLARYALGRIEEKQYNYEFTAQNSDEKIKVQVYFGKKGVKSVLQGNPNSTFYNEIENALFDQKKLVFDKPVILDNEPEEYIGADESGKGDFFGPLVTSAVCVNKDDIQTLKKIGAIDSKLLNESQIMRISEEIKSLLKDKFVITSLVPHDYNQVYAEKKNLNKLLREEHQKNISILIKKCKVENVIIDSFEKKKFVIDGKAKIFQTEKAERFTGVAAASILARSELVNWFENNLIDKKIKLPKGASLEVNNFIKRFDNSPGINWANFCKLHFKSYQNFTM